jgi:hypothetical protein
VVRQNDFDLVVGNNVKKSWYEKFKKCHLENFSEEIEGNHKKSVRGGLH